MDTAESIKLLGQLLKRARQQKGWTLAEVAAKSGLSAGYIGNTEKGYINPKRGPVVPSDDSLRALSGALEIPLREMHQALGRVDEDDELAREPFIDELRQAGYLNHLPPATQEEIMDYIRFKAEQVRSGAKTPVK